MGLDLRPMGKAKPGFEKRYEQIFKIITGAEKEEVSFFDKLKGKKPATKEELLQEWFANQIPSYETIKAPRVGRDEEANNWIKERYQETDKSLSENDFVKQHDGYYVISLAKEEDGVPAYRSFGQDENVFRGEFIRDCVDLIGEDLVSEAWGTKLAKEALDYGNRLMNIADKIAAESGLEYLKLQRNPPEKSDEGDLENKLHVVSSMAKWLIFYGKNGHGYEADY
ncbi:MAG: hypothetical protein ACOVP7_05470 [Lacibacter sp.]